MLTLQQFNKLVQTEQEARGCGWRIGQTISYIFHIQRQDLKELLKEAGYDPYFDDSKILIFNQWLSRNWDLPKDTQIK